jgi:hypothetical protein
MDYSKPSNKELLDWAVVAVLTSVAVIAFIRWIAV